MTFRYTAPVSGVYLVNVQLSVQTQNTTTLRGIQLLKNGVLQTGYSSVATLQGNRRNMLNLSSLILLTAGDTLSVQYSGVVGDTIKLADTSLNIHLLSI